jgi:hypothetical protein
MGFGAGGIHTRAYPSFGAALDDAIARARAMSIHIVNSAAPHRPMQ